MPDGKQGKHSPCIPVLAASLPVVPVGLQDGLEPLLRHTGPGKCNVGGNYLLRRRRQVLEEVIGNDAKRPATRAAAGAEQVRLMLTIYPQRNDLSCRLDRQNVQRREPVRRCPVQA